MFLILGTTLWKTKGYIICLLVHKNLNYSNIAIFNIHGIFKSCHKDIPASAIHNKTMKLLSNGILNNHWSDLKKNVSDIILQKIKYVWT